MVLDLVRPNFAQLQVARASKDSNVLGRENSLELRQDGFLHADSPPVSVGSGGGASGHLSLEVVLSSVHYLVWIHHMDGKARCVPGVYSQLCSRGAARTCFWGD